MKIQRSSIVTVLLYLVINPTAQAWFKIVNDSDHDIFTKLSVFSGYETYDIPMLVRAHSSKSSDQIDPAYSQPAISVANEHLGENLVFFPWKESIPQRKLITNVTLTFGKNGHITGCSFTAMPGTNACHTAAEGGTGTCSDAFHEGIYYIPAGTQLFKCSYH